MTVLECVHGNLGGIRPVSKARFASSQGLGRSLYVTLEQTVSRGRLGFAPFVG